MNTDIVFNAYTIDRRKGISYASTYQVLTGFEMTCNNVDMVFSIF